MTKSQNQASSIPDSRSLHVVQDDEPKVDDRCRYFWRAGWNAYREALATPAQQTDAQAEHCQCCGYLVTDREHLGCLRAGRGNAELHKDAERYRWLRSIGHEQLNVMAHYADTGMDKQIDATIAKEKAKS